jgi:hypothetical protein
MPAENAKRLAASHSGAYGKTTSAQRENVASTREMPLRISAFCVFFAVNSVSRS